MVPFALYVATKTDLKKASQVFIQEHGRDVYNREIKPVLQKRGKMGLLNQDNEYVVAMVNAVQQVVAERLGEEYEPLPQPRPERSAHFHR